MTKQEKKSRFNFTKDALDNLPACAKVGHTDNYYDQKRLGLAMRVTSKGVKTFYHIARGRDVTKKTTWHKIGRYPEMTIEQASKSVIQLLAKLSTGIDPKEAQRELKGEPTMNELFSMYMEKHGEQKKSSKDDEQRYRIHIKPVIGNRKISTVSDGDIRRIAERMAKAGRAGATINRVRALLSVMFNKASIDYGLTTRTNPAKALSHKKEKSRERFLSPAELPRFAAAVQLESVDWRDFFMFLLFAGQRRQNTLAMRWSDVHFHPTPVWYIKETKNGDPHAVPLTGVALSILESRFAHRKGDEDFVFPGHGKTGHLSEPKTAWKRVISRANLPDLRIHDLRRTNGSWQAMGGVSLAIIAKVLGHKNLATTQVYARLDMNTSRDALQNASDRMSNAMKASM